MTEVWPGRPFPLGPTWDGTGTNFSIFSENAERVELCLFDDDGRETRCGMHEQKPHLENCCKSKKCCVMVADKSPIVFKCLGCGQSARDEGKIAHDASNIGGKQIDFDRDE